MENSKPIIYSTPTCPYCLALKEFLTQKSIEFEDIDVSRDREAARRMIEKTGQMGVPVLEYKGDFVIGFDKERVIQLLGIDKF